MVRIGAYLVHWRAPEWCSASVAALERSDGVHVAVTVINNSSDCVPRLTATAELVNARGNLGFSGGANLALDLAAARGGGHVLLGCHDVAVEPTAVAEMVAMLEQDSGLGVVGPVLNGQGEHSHSLEWVSGTLMLIRDELAQGLRFDERFGSYVEDVDFCVRARIGERAWRIGRCGTAHATSSGSVDPELASRLTDSNMIGFYAQHHLWRKMLGRMLAMIRQRRLRDLLAGTRMAFVLRGPASGTSRAWPHRKA